MGGLSAHTREKKTEEIRIFQQKPWHASIRWSPTKRQTDNTSSDNEQPQRATANHNERHNKRQQAPQRDTTSANEVAQRETMSAKELTSANEWQRVAILANLSFFSDKRGTYHHKP